MGLFTSRKALSVHEKKKIGIMASRSGAGARHLCMALAVYLSSYEKYETAVIDCREEGLKGLLTKDLLFDYGTGGFRLMGVSIYEDHEYAIIPAALEKKYDRIIYLLPKEGKGPEVFFGICDIRFMIGGMRPWEYGEYQLLIKQCTADYKDISGCVCLSNGLGEEERKMFVRDMHCSVIGIPRIEDPFKLRKCDVEFLRSLTATG